MKYVLEMVGLWLLLVLMALLSTSCSGSQEKTATRGTPKLHISQLKNVDLTHKKLMSNGMYYYVVYWDMRDTTKHDCYVSVAFADSLNIGRR